MTTIPDGTVTPTTANLHRDEYGGTVTVDNRHEVQDLNWAVIGTVLPLATGTGWVWITTGDPTQARTADTEQAALEALLEDTLTEYPTESDVEWDRIINTGRAA